MKKSVFITGISGFLGRVLLRNSDWSAYQNIYCLVRNPQDPFLQDVPAHIKMLSGDLASIDEFSPIPDDVDTVIHMAAVTGKAKPKNYFKVNADATQFLLQMCEKSNVKYFLFVSSIAAKFKYTNHYYYARSKQQAESHVQGSGLKYTILRPTMIFGKGSSIVSGFSRFTRFPFIPVFGKGDIQVQPVHVDDVAETINHIVRHSRFDNEIIELGGREICSIQNLLERIHQKQKGGKSRFFHIPVPITTFLLALLEPLFYSMLPLTRGQLATFKNIGTIHENEVFLKLSPRFKKIDQMIDDGLQIERIQQENYKRECRVFCRYLTAQKENDFVLNKYIECHSRVDMKARDKFDSFLVRLASRNPLFTRFCDSFSRFFYSPSLIRKKLVYLLAILENSPPYCSFLDKADEKGKLMLLLAIGLKGVGFGFHLFFSFIFLFPLKILLGSKKKRIRT